MKPILSKEEGFTLLETLLSLMISSFVLLLLTGGLLTLVKMRDTMVSHAQTSAKSNQMTGDRQVEWHIFLNQLENYLQGSYGAEVTLNNIYVKEPVDFETDYQEVNYRIDGSRINFSRREKNGYQRMLTELEKIDFTRVGGWLEAEVLFLNGEAFSGRIWIASWSVEIEEEEEELEEETEEEDEIIEQ